MDKRDRDAVARYVYSQLMHPYQRSMSAGHWKMEYGRQTNLKEERAPVTITVECWRNHIVPPRSFQTGLAGGWTDEQLLERIRGLVARENEENMRQDRIEALVHTVTEVRGFMGTLLDDLFDRADKEGINSYYTTMSIKDVEWYERELAKFTD